MAPRRAAVAAVVVVLALLSASTPIRAIVRWTSSGDLILSPRSGRKVYVGSKEIALKSDVDSLRSTVNTLAANAISKKQYTWSSVANGARYTFRHNHATYDVVMQAYYLDTALNKYVGVEKLFMPCTECGNGANGAYSATSNRNLGASTYQYTSFYIQSSRTVTVTGSNKLFIYSQGAVVIDGTLNLDGKPGTNQGRCRTCYGSYGGAGVANGGAGGRGSRYNQGTGYSGGGSGYGRGGYRSTRYGGGGGGGASHYAYGVAGTNGRSECRYYYSGGARGSTYGSTAMSDTHCRGGSGGGGGGACYYGGASYDPGAGGGGGGGALKITAPDITVRGYIYARGGNGGRTTSTYSGGGGGGSGGTIWLRGTRVTTASSARLYTHGGTGGTTSYSGCTYGGRGGNGGHGRVNIDGGSRSLSGGYYPGAVQRTITLGQMIEYGVHDSNNVFIHNLSGATRNIKVVVVG